MQTIYLHSAGTWISIAFPASIEHLVKIVFPDFKTENVKPATINFEINTDENSNFNLFENGTCLARQLEAKHCALSLMHEVVRAIVGQYKVHIALHAGAVIKNARAVVLPAQSGSGKTSLVAWLTANGYDYLTDELVLFNCDNTIDAFYRPLNIKATGLDLVKSLRKQVSSNQEIITDSTTLWAPDLLGQRAKVSDSLELGLFVFPLYKKDSELKIEILTPAQAGLELMACNINARNIDDHGFKLCANLVRNKPAIRLMYSQFEQLENIFMPLMDSLSSGEISPKKLRKLLNNHSYTGQHKPTTDYVPRAIPKISKPGKKKKLCIGMATYDDYDGVYFSVQSIRLFHSEIIEQIEIIIIDNNPTGKCAADLKALDTQADNLRYIPLMDKSGTSVAKNAIFEHANAEYVLCIDCHVLIEPGAIAKLIDYFELNVDCPDLLQGPMLDDDLNSVSTHFKPVWSGGMYGVWGCDKRGKNAHEPPFEIPMQGMGLFACRYDCWPGFNKNFRGFGAEEGYIHEKFRQAGGRTLCLPFLRWVHRFARPLGVPYPNNWPDRIRNYLIGFSELNLDTLPILEHFSTFLNEESTLQVVKSFEEEFKSL